MSDLNNEISTASEEQASGLSQINHAMNQIDSSSQSNASATEEILSTTESMASFAESTQAEILKLSLMLNAQTQGGQAQPPNHVAPPAAPSSHASHPPLEAGRVVPFKKTTSPSARAHSHEVSKTEGLKPSDIIPFDEDERAKVGSTDDF